MIQKRRSKRRYLGGAYLNALESSSILVVLCHSNSSEKSIICILKIFILQLVEDFSSYKTDVFKLESKLLSVGIQTLQYSNCCKFKANILTHTVMFKANTL